METNLGSQTKEHNYFMNRRFSKAQVATQDIINENSASENNSIRSRGEPLNNIVDENEDSFSEDEEEINLDLHKNKEGKRNKVGKNTDLYTEPTDKDIRHSAIDNFLKYQNKSDASYHDSDSDSQKDSEQSRVINPDNIENDGDILEFYKKLRANHSPDNPWEDNQFVQNKKHLWKHGEEPPERLKTFQIEFHQPINDSEELCFFSENSTLNIQYEFKIKRGILNDKCFIGAVLMLFRRKDQFLTNLVIDYENVNENLKAGFCGFTFFINGEWRNVTIDTKIPHHQEDEFVLSTATCNKTCFWLPLLQKAYAKIYQNYDVLNGVSIKNTLVDFTGGIAKKFTIKEKIDDIEKKMIFDEVKKSLNQKYLIGCMKFETGEDNLDESKSDEDDDEEILINCIYNVLDLQEVDGYRLIYLCNYWNRGKWTKYFGTEDEVWETNKGLKEKLGYDVLQDGTFWMTFEDWLIQFNTVYYCRIFPENWSQFCIPGSWTGLFSGGAPPNNSLEPWRPERVDEKSGQLQKRATANKLMHLNSIKDGTVFNKKKPSFALNSKPSVYGKQLKYSELQADENIENIVNPLDKSKLTMSKFSDKVVLSNSNPVSHIGKSSKTIFFNSGKAMNQLVNNQSKSQFLKEISDQSRNKELLKRVILNENEDRWFLNPQYKVEVKPGTKLIISLFQKDTKLQDEAYQKCNFVIILCQGRYSRVWDFKEGSLIKKAFNYADNSKASREVLVTVDYYEILRKIPQKLRKKLKSEILRINIVPYIDYSAKYEIEKYGNNKIFKIFKQEGIFWLRIFSSEDIYVAELQNPYEKSLEFEWTEESAGGGRYIRDLDKNKIVENPNWVINPQYLIKFEKNISMKIIIRKTQGRFKDEATNIGMIITKPTYETTNLSSKKMKNSVKSFNKNDQILRVLESTDKILESKKFELSNITRKMTLNSSEWIAESSYSNNYCASVFMNFNKIDSPLIVIPTLEYPEAVYSYKLSIYSNRQLDLYSLDNYESKIVVGEWKNSNYGGSHLTHDEKNKQRDQENFGSKIITWLDNPKFHLSFDDKDFISELEFEIIVSRSETIWKKKISNSIVNSMIGVYIFKFDKEKWMEKCLNKDNIDFMPKNEISNYFKDHKVDPKGYILMPCTYGANVPGPFSLMVKCKVKFNLCLFKDNN